LSLTMAKGDLRIIDPSLQGLKVRGMAPRLATVLSLVWGLGLMAPLAQAEPSHGLSARLKSLNRPRLVKQPAVEMSDLIIDLMPVAGTTRFDWDPKLKSSVIWLGEKPARNEQGDSQRQALARIHMQGTAAVALHRRRREIAWTIRFITDQGRPQGPRWIEISPGIPGKGCFGAFYKGCLFTAEQVFASAPLNPRLLCRVGDMFSFNQVYRVSSPGRSDVAVVYSYTNADDDETAWVEIHKLSDAGRFCKGH
jgi:hypothetical protein